MIALCNVIRFSMVIWILYGLVLLFAPSVVHRPADPVRGGIQIVIAFALGYLTDRVISLLHRRLYERELADSPPPVSSGTHEI